MRQIVKQGKLPMLWFSLPYRTSTKTRNAQVDLFEGRPSCLGFPNPRPSGVTSKRTPKVPPLARWIRGQSEQPNEPNAQGVPVATEPIVLTEETGRSSEVASGCFGVLFYFCVE